MTTAALLTRNLERARLLKQRSRDLTPSLRTVVITCADHRVDPADVLGLRAGEAVVLRNPGGRVTRDLLRSLQVLSRVADLESVATSVDFLVLHHTDCGLTRLSGPEHKDLVADYVGVAEDELPALAVGSPQAAARYDAALLEAMISSPGATVTGAVYDLETGRVSVVYPAREIYENQASAPREARIAPLEPPFEDSVDSQLTSMMPAGVPPIALFRTFAHNMPMSQSMAPWGRYELSRELSLPMRARELIIDRTCARCGADYEWGVHVAFFAERVGLGSDQIASLASGSPDDECWTDPMDRLIIRAADQLHDDADLDDEMWAQLAAELTDAQILDLLTLCGWYHAISFVCRALRVPLEEGAPTLDQSTDRDSASQGA